MRQVSSARLAGWTGGGALTRTTLPSFHCVTMLIHVLRAACTTLRSMPYCATSCATSSSDMSCGQYDRLRVRARSGSAEVSQSFVVALRSTVLRRLALTASTSSAGAWTATRSTKTRGTAGDAPSGAGYSSDPPVDAATDPVELPAVSATADAAPSWAMTSCMSSCDIGDTLPVEDDEEEEPAGKDVLLAGRARPPPPNNPLWWCDSMPREDDEPDPPVLDGLSPASSASTAVHTRPLKSFQNDAVASRCDLRCPCDANASGRESRRDRSRAAAPCSCCLPSRQASRRSRMASTRGECSAPTGMRRCCGVVASSAAACTAASSYRSSSASSMHASVICRQAPMMSLAGTRGIDRGRRTSSADRRLAAASIALLGSRKDSVPSVITW